MTSSADDANQRIWKEVPAADRSAPHRRIGLRTAAAMRKGLIGGIIVDPSVVRPPPDPGELMTGLLPALEAKADE